MLSDIRQYRRMFSRISFICAALALHGVTFSGTYSSIASMPTMPPFFSCILEPFGEFVLRTLDLLRRKHGLFVLEQPAHLV